MQQKAFTNDPHKIKLLKIGWKVEYEIKAYKKSARKQKKGYKAINFIIKSKDHHLLHQIILYLIFHHLLIYHVIL